MSRTIIVSNRLPVTVENRNGYSFKPSEGGLATGLGSVYKQGENLWIGWPGVAVSKKSDQAFISEELKKDNMRPVFLSKKEMKDFYEGFSNETLWPNFHYFNEFVKFDEKLWKAYVKVNRKFCAAVIPYVQESDTVWVHDYQLLLLPQLIREHFPKIAIGFFQHIPFPSYENFRLLPWRRQLLEGMLGSDLIGFHTYDDMRHFLSSVNRIAGLSNQHGQIDLPDRIVRVDPFPMGIDYEKYSNAATEPKTIDREKRYRATVGDVKVILSIDRLDYSKGIPQRLNAFEKMLEKHPQYMEKVSLLMVVVPSRDKVQKYKELKESVDKLVGRINGKYSRMKWTPIYYFYRSLNFNALSAFYKIADVALVTPMRDGMNLVCKEYIASKRDKNGVLILSERAGASKELSDAILVNPSDISQIADAMVEALEMPLDERQRRFEIMQETIKTYNIHHWVKLFMDRLDVVKQDQKALLTRKLEDLSLKTFNQKYREASSRLIFLDYDGTLTAFTAKPGQATPDIELLAILKNLSSDPRNRIVIISGRDHETLSAWFNGMPIDMIGEHGVWIKDQNEDWRTLIKLDNSWKEVIKEILNTYVSRTPGSFIEEKQYSLVWHFRKVETGLGELRSRELMSHLKYMAEGQDLQVLEGNMVVEIKNKQVNKGVAATKWMEKFKSDFIVAIGDDWTDEDTFRAMPPHSFSIKVGGGISAAKYSLRDPAAVRKLLTGVAGKVTSNERAKSQ